MKILILGAGGFIGSHLVERFCERDDVEVIASDVVEGKLSEVEGHYYTFKPLDIDDADDAGALEELISSVDTVINCAAYANPSLYIKEPLEVFEVNFEANRRIMKMCHAEDKWLIQFSSCEIYGRTASSVGFYPEDTQELKFSEDSPSILGPVTETRWIYATAKRLLEHLIMATDDLKWTVIRPFNFIGPRIDFLPSLYRGYDVQGKLTLPAPRVFSCFMDQLLMEGCVKLVDGGLQRRAYTHINDAVKAVELMLDNPESSQGEAFNIGSPENETTMHALALSMGTLYKKHFNENAQFALEVVTGEEFYGKGYADCDRRIPDIRKIQTLLGWEPSYSLDEILLDSMTYCVEQSQQAQLASGKAI